MSLPRNSIAYPPSFLSAIERAFSLGELTIPTEKPKALRLQFQGLRGALRRENRADIIDSVMFCVQESPPALILRSRDASSAALDVAKALETTQVRENPSSVTDDAEAALDRILGKSNA
jgi:hypothetical protein